MNINKDSLKARVKNISEKTGVSANIIYPLYFYDSFLKRLSKSKYRDCFILKGGFYLSTLFGIENRPTIDIDFYVKRIKLERDNLIQTIEEIINVDCDDLVKLKIVEVSIIRQNDNYGGFSFTLNGRLDNININFAIDLATGDPITPHVNNYKYISKFDSSEINLKAYPLETVVAEKLETILERGLTCSRIKDYYDLYYIFTYKLDFVCVDILSLAVRKTFEYRKLCVTKSYATNLIKQIKGDERFDRMWESFKRKKHYINSVKFDDVISSVMQWIEFVF